MNFDARQSGGGMELDRQVILRPAERVGPRYDTLLQDRLPVGIEEHDEQTRTLLGRVTRLHLFAADPRKISVCWVWRPSTPTVCSPARPGVLFWKVRHLSPGFRSLGSTLA
jgi:hypothetical protein